MQQGTVEQLTLARTSSKPKVKRSSGTNTPLLCPLGGTTLSCVLYTGSQSFLCRNKLQVLGLIKHLYWLSALLCVTSPFPPGVVYTPPCPPKDNYIGIFVLGTASVKISIRIIVKFSIFTWSPPLRF